MATMDVGRSYEKLHRRCPLPRTQPKARRQTSRGRVPAAGIAECRGSAGVGRAVLPSLARVPWLIALVLVWGWIGAAQAQTLIVGTAEWRPWQIFERDRMTGITAEILDQLARRTGITLKVVQLPHRRLMAEFKAQRIDLEPTVDAAWREDQRAISVYTQPFFATRDILLVRQESGIKGDGASDFRGLVIGCGLGYYYPEGFQAAFDNGEIHRDNNPTAENNLKKLLHRRIDGAILDNLQAAYLLDAFRIDANRFTIAYRFQPSELSLRLQKRHRVLLPVLNKAIAGMIADGTVDRIVAGYAR